MRGIDIRHMISVQESRSGATFAVKVHPRAKKNAITGEVGDALKLSLTAPPVDNKANAACVEFFAKFFNIPRSCVSIVSGETSRRKTIRVTGMRAEDVKTRFAEAVAIHGRT